MLLLHEESLGTLDLDDWTAYVTEALAIPFAEVRAVTDPRTDAHGTYDQTRHIGARAVSATVVAFADATHSVEDRVDAVRAYLNPSLRPTLTWTPVGSSTPRRMVVRADSYDVTIADDRWVRGSIQLVCPSGVVEGTELHTATIQPSGAGTVAGRVYPLAFDRSYPESSGGSGGAILHNAGSGPANWVARLYGSCSNPELTNLTTGETMLLAGLTIAAGHYVELDSAAHTAWLDGDPTLSVYQYITLGSTWAPLIPGDNEVEFTPDTSAPGSEAVIEWRDTWL